MLKNNTFVNLFRYFWRYSPDKRMLFGFIFLSLAANAIGIVTPLVIGRVFNSVQFANEDPNVLGDVMRGLSLLATLSVSVWFFHGPARILEERHAFLVRKNYKQKKFDQILQLSAQWHKDHHSGETIDKINKASQRLFDFSSTLFMLVGALVRFIGAIAILTIFEWRSVMVIIVVAGVAIWTVVLFDRVLRKGYRKIYKAENFLASGLHDYVSNIVTVITLRLERRASKEIDARSMRAYEIFNRNAKLNETKWFLVGLYITLTTVGIVAFSAYSSFKLTGVIAIGNLFILYKYLEGIGSVFSTFAWKWGEMVSQESALKEAELIEKEFSKIKHHRKYSLPKKWKKIEVKNLKFGYKKKVKESEDQQKDINFKSNEIKKISFAFERGQRIAFIGESGCGKSTVFSLLRGLHNTDRAEVFVDGKKLIHGMKHFYRHVLLIPQEPELFNATVEENITMGEKTTIREVEKSIKLARFEKVAAKLEKGLKTNVLEKGVSLSGGEKQRLAVARGLLAIEKHDIVLLDEPTSSVDSGNEMQIYQNIFKEFPQKTIFSAVHRLHLLNYFDYIYYFKQGQIIEEGTLAQLMQKANFRKVWDKYNSNDVASK